MVRAGLKPTTSKFQVRLPVSLVGETFRNHEPRQWIHEVPRPRPCLSIIHEYSSVHTCIPNMHPILIAHRMPSKHSDATC